MQVRINAQGSVESVHTIWPEPSLTEAAVQAVRRWHFTSNGPLSTIVVILFLAPFRDRSGAVCAGITTLSP